MHCHGNNTEPICWSQGPTESQICDAGSGGGHPQVERIEKGETALVVTPRSTTESTAFANGGQFGMAHRRDIGSSSLPSIPSKLST